MEVQIGLVFPKYFWRVVAAQYYRDPFSNIDNQYSIGTAAGYDFIHSPKTELECAFGIGYQNQKFISVTAGEDDIVDTPFFIAKARYDTELTETLDFLADYSFRILNETSGTFTHHAMAKLSRNSWPISIWIFPSSGTGFRRLRNGKMERYQSRMTIS